LEETADHLASDALRVSQDDQAMNTNRVQQKEKAIFI
jgi:hypothetical protein